MSNIRNLQYNDKTGKCGIIIQGKTHWFNKNAAYQTKKPGVYGVKIGARNFFFPINDSLTYGGANPFGSVADNKPSRNIPPIVFPRIRVDPNYWREALYEAENKPWNWRVMMQTIMQDTILDAHVKACWTKRKRMTLLKKPAFFDKKGNIIENNPDLEFIYSDWWIQLLDFMLDAQGYGYQLIELGDIKDMTFPDIGVVPRQNISPDREIVASIVYNVNGVTFNINPEDRVQVGKKVIETSSQSPNGQYYYDWTIWVKTPNEFGSHTSTCGYGLFYWISLYAILIRNNLQNNADFNEKFLQPIRWLQTDTTDKTERQQKFQQLVDAGSSLTFLTDLEEKLTLLQNNTSGTTYNSYSLFEERLKKAVSALTLGHEDAMHSQPGKRGGQQGGGGSIGSASDNSPIAQALQETESEQNRWLCAQVNANLPKFRKLGFKIPFDIKYGYPNDIEANEQQEIQNKHNIDFTTALVNLQKAGYEVDPKYVEEITGIPVKKAAPPPAPKPGIAQEEPDEEEITAVENLLKDLKKTYGKHTH